MIISRRVGLALAAVAVAAAIVLIVRSRRRPALPAPVRHEHEHAPAEPAPPAGRPVDRWPPAPVLGTPTAEDLARYAAAGPPTIPAFLQGGHDRPAREPLDAATRRRLIRWGAAGLALCLVAGGGQLVESAVFSKQPGLSQDKPCSTDPPGADCLFAELREGGTASGPVEPDPESWTAPDPDCHPGSRALPALAPDAKVTRAVHRQWRRIERWLKTHAPKSHRTLAGPAEPATVAAVEARMGRRLPADLRASLLRHDGAVTSKDTWGFGFLGNTSLSVREMLDTWRGLCDVDGQDYGGEESDPRSEWWDGRMLPVGSDGTGNHLVVDSVRHDVGDTDNEGTMDFTPGGVRVRSYHTLLKATADALEKGRAIGYWKPEVVAGELEWTVLPS
ncbi:SMI1/KNR4 family protein [Nonomuraea roseoviolacea]|uniref:SMI1/KNR4 family protein n=1 Tax=Nonomuraea roseoviolacea TaxID=103837 RepID=UPI0031DC0CFA